MWCYGMSIEEYTRMETNQGGVCAICKEQERDKAATSERVRRLSVDHAHHTGVIRGLLCNRCNRAIGLFGDSADLLDVASAYLRQASVSVP